MQRFVLCLVLLVLFASVALAITKAERSAQYSRTSTPEDDEDLQELAYEDVVKESEKENAQPAAVRALLRQPPG